MTTILLVDDEPTMVRVLTYNLQKEGYEVLCAYDGAEGLALARSKQPDLVVLDVMLPGMSGLDVCRVLRTESTVPILMLTARAAEADRIVGLELGADDYLIKPFALGELIARIRAMLRRIEMLAVKPSKETDLIQKGLLRIDAARHEVTWRDTVLSLRPREFDLLLYLARHEGQVLSRDTLLAGVWGYDHIGDPRTVDVHIRWLREKLEPDPSQPRYVQTVRGTGYKLVL